MKIQQVTVQIYTVRAHLKTPGDIVAALKKVRAIGYQAVELIGLSTVSDAELNDDAGIVAEIVAPRLWFSPMTIDGAYTSNNPKCRQHAIERSLRTMDIANILGTKLSHRGTAGLQVCKNPASRRSHSIVGVRRMFRARVPPRWFPSVRKRE